MKEIKQKIQDLISQNEKKINRLIVEKAICDKLDFSTEKSIKEDKIKELQVLNDELQKIINPT